MLLFSVIVFPDLSVLFHEATADPTDERKLHRLQYADKTSRITSGFYNLERIFPCSYVKETAGDNIEIDPAVNWSNGSAALHQKQLFLTLTGLDYYNN